MPLKCWTRENSKGGKYTTCEGNKNKGKSKPKSKPKPKPVPKINIRRIATLLRTTLNSDV